MKKSSLPTVVLVFCLSSTPGVGGAQSETSVGPDTFSVSLSSPEPPTWAVLVDLPGFEVEVNGVKPDGRRYLLTSNKATGVNASVTLEKASEPATAEGCQKYLQRILAVVAPRSADARVTTLGEMQLVEYTLPLEDHAFVQRNLFACVMRADVYVVIHLSKVRFQDNDEGLFRAVLDSVRFTNRPLEDSFTYWLRGGAAYLQRQFKQAISLYRKSLELDKERPRLDRTYWRVLIDNLGMAYGVTGDLENAKETFEHGLAKDPTYPLFYYNLACTYAERKDPQTALEFLRKAFAFKQNLIPGERMPDPRIDDSFKPFIKQKGFREEVESLAGYLDSVHLSLPKREWELVIDLPGFTLEPEQATRWGGRTVNGFHEEQDIFVTVTLTPSSARAGIGDCEESLAKTLEGHKSLATSVKRSESNGVKWLEYVVISSPLRGVSPATKNMEACLERSDAVVRIELWKAGFDKKDEELMRRTLASARFAEKQPAAPN